MIGRPAHQRTDEAEGMVPRAQLHLSFHGRNDLDHDTPVCSRGGYMTMCSNDRLGRFANRSSHKFKSQRQPPERPSGFSVILRGRKRSLSPVTFACPVSSLSGLKRVGSSPIADGNCRGAHVAASALLSGLSQNDPYHRVQSAPCHVVKRLSCGSAKRQQTTTMEGRMVQLARRLGLGHRRVRSIYQNEPGVALRADEAAAIAALRQEQRQTDDEYQALASRIARLEALYAREGEGVHSEHVAGLSAALNAGRGTNGTGGTGE